jgi:hypothetical protein
VGGKCLISSWEGGLVQYRQFYTTNDCLAHLLFTLSLSIFYFPIAIHVRIVRPSSTSLLSLASTMQLCKNFQAVLTSAMPCILNCNVGIIQKCRKKMFQTNQNVSFGLRIIVKARLTFEISYKLAYLVLYRSHLLARLFFFPTECCTCTTFAASQQQYARSAHFPLRGRLHLLESVNELLCDFMHDLLLRILIFFHTSITTVCKHISEKIDTKFDCNPHLAPNRTPNRMPIRTRIRTCRRPLTVVAKKGVLLCSYTLFSSECQTAH